MFVLLNYLVPIILQFFGANDVVLSCFFPTLFCHFGSRFKADGHHYKQTICSFISGIVVPICEVRQRFCTSLSYIARHATGLSSTLDSVGISSTLFRVVRVVRVSPGTCLPKCSCPKRRTIFSCGAHGEEKGG